MRLATPLVRWAAFPLPDTISGEVRFDVGDCLFACVAFWLNVALQRTMFNARSLRHGVAGALAWPETRPLLESILQELQATAGLVAAPTLAEAQALVLRRDCWGCHGLLVVLTFFCSRLLERRVGFVIAELTPAGAVRQPPLQVPDEGDFELGCVLHYQILGDGAQDNNHYRLLASRSGAVLFDVRALRWLPSVAALDAAGEAAGAASEASSEDEEAWCRRRGEL